MQARESEEVSYFKYFLLLKQRNTKNNLKRLLKLF